MFKIGRVFFATLVNDGLKPKVITHKPVLLNEVLDTFKSVGNEIVLDLTFGFGGHSKAILNCNRTTVLIGIDRDDMALQHAFELSTLYPQLVTVHGKFSNLNEICMKNNINKKSVDFILMDLGASSLQMDDGSRGFSLSKNAKLDMRMDKNSNDITAFDVINYLSAFELSDIFKKYGDEKHSRKIAKMLVDYRSTAGYILTTQQLAELIGKCIGWGHHYDALKRKAHPATQIFQALRIFVNDELNELWSGLTVAKEYLKPVSGRCVVISFHSLEDRLVKYAFHDRDFDGIDNCLSRMTSGVLQADQDNLIWKQVGNFILPTEEEIKLNPRARSARMRIGKVVKQ